jgi:hypothetical protein
VAIFVLSFSKKFIILTTLNLSKVNDSSAFLDIGLREIDILGFGKIYFCRKEIIFFIIVIINLGLRSVSSFFFFFIFIFLKRIN